MISFFVFNRIVIVSLLVCGLPWLSALPAPDGSNPPSKHGVTAHPLDYGSLDEDFIDHEMLMHMEDGIYYDQMGK